MRLSLRTKVSLVITAVIIVISGVSTYLFTTAYSSSKERGRIQRGEALSYALSEAAAEGLLKEDLNLIKKRPLSSTPMTSRWSRSIRTSGTLSTPILSTSSRTRPIPTPWSTSGTPPRRSTSR